MALKFDTRQTVPVAVRVVALLSIMLVPLPAYAGIVFTWVPTDGSPSSGTMTINAPASGPFSLPGTAVTSLDFTFKPGLSVSLTVQSESTNRPIVSFDGSSLDYGDYGLSRFFYPIDSVFGFLPEQLGADVAIYDLLGLRAPTVRVWGKWIRADITPPQLPPYPRGVVSVIDIRSIVESHIEGANVQGVAYDPDRNVIYVSHGSDPRSGFIYTLDMSGHLLSELDFQKAYRPRSFPTSISYDSKSRHLFVFALGEDLDTHNLVEMRPDGAVIGDITLTDIEAGNPIVRDDGIWRPVFAKDLIRHYTRDGVFIEDVSLAASFLPDDRDVGGPGFPGPFALTSSLTDDPSGGFFIVDHFGERIVQVDREGHEIADVTTGMLGGGRALVIATDPVGQRIFLQGSNSFIFVLSPQFMKIQNVSNLLTLHEDELTTTFDPTPVPAGPRGTFRIQARFENVSGHDICGLFFRVVDLSTEVGRGGQLLESVSLEPSRQQLQGFDQLIIGHRPVVMKGNHDATIAFTLDLQTLIFFHFFVDAWGTPLPPGSACP